MASQLDEMQFEILPSVDAATGVTFGIDSNISVDDGGFDPGTDSWDDQDGQSATRGVTQFGRDILTGPSWAWTMHTNRETVTGALESLGQIKTAWRAREIRETPGAVLPIRYRMGNRVRRVYGRPRSFAAPPSNLILNGLVPITADFKCVDALTYDDIESSAVITSATSPGGDAGFLFPAIFPVSTLATEGTQGRPGAIYVDGDEPTYPIIRFDGPRVRPTIVAEDWRLDLDITLLTGEYVVIDTRPWENSVLKNGSQYVGGLLGRRQWLSNMVLTPGQHELQFSAASGSGACTVSWRSAWNSI